MIADITLETVCANARNLPCQPSLLPEINEMQQRDDVVVQDLAHLVERDPVLTASVLRLANSAFYSPGKCYDDLNQAIMRLGFRQTFEVVSTVMALRWSSVPATGYGWAPGDCVRHTLGVACAARALANLHKKVAPGSAYTAALVHDFGKLAMSAALGDKLLKVFHHQNQYNCFWTEAETAVFGFNHCDVSRVLMEEWNFPPNLIQTAVHYENPTLAEEEHYWLVATVHAAKHLIIESGLGGGFDCFSTRLDEQVPANLGLDEHQMHGVLPKVMAELSVILGSNFHSGPITF